MKTKHYYVSQDLETIVSRWCQDERKDAGCLKCPPAELFEELRADLIAALEHAFREPVGDDKHKVAIKPLRLTDLHVIRRDPSDKRDFWITLDDVAVPSHDYHLEITRIYDMDARKIGVGPRIGAKTLLQQVADCQAKYFEYARTALDPQIVLVDDGAYEGGSVLAVADMLKKHDLPVSVVNLGFSTSKGLKAIAEALCPPEFEQHATIGVSKFIEIDAVHVWVCERDFYLGVPRSGRTFGFSEKPDRALPHQSRISFPYVEPFAVARGGGSIDIGKYSFGRAQVLASIRLWSEIERLNNRTFMVADIPRFPGPGLEREYAIYEKTPWIEYIRKIALPVFSDI